MHATRIPARIVLAAMAAGLTLPLIAHSSSQASTTLTAFADPTADEVITTAIAAVGGQAALDRINTLHASLVLNMGMEAKMETLWSRAGGRVMKVAFGAENMTMATDGTLAWMNGPDGFMLMPDDQKEDLDDQATLLMKFIDIRNQMQSELTSIENTGKATFETKDCWKLHYKDKDGEEGDVFFDAAGGLPVGFESVEKDGETETRTKVVLSDWKEVEGVKFHHGIAITSSDMPGVAMSMTVSKVEINTLEPKEFVAPEEVVKLAAAKPAATTAPAAEIKLEDMTPEQQKMAAEALAGFKQSGDVNTMKQMVQRIEPVIGMVPADQQLPMKYALQELKKEIAKLGG